MVRVASVVLATGALAMGGAGLAGAQEPSNRVTVFETELQPLTKFEDPQGCHKLPLASHVIVNDTDRVITVYGDPFCMTPGLQVPPGHGSHVPPGTGSFSA
ncbi:hypothetical protein QFW96_00430 [Saccharopolyspora sp. TS4A08]|uniref:Uncharacterized protein n=1 Tax=Saccharopolyspora ipomoeae TaxID=3042027 RepID=A0ABT6PGC5_9PSEU|nr:hypothetical protein [Saccharopolyspora sp. TS4A08]MDI2027048.1 hypothetical protein [Saccharopolyspora sp. TS4A08]